MIHYIVAVIVILAIFVIIYWPLKRKYQFNFTEWLKIWMLKQLHLYDPPVGQFKDFVKIKAKKWENTKENFILIPLLAGYGFFALYWLMPWLFFNLLFFLSLSIGATIIVVFTILLSTFVYIKYYAHYTKHQAFEVTVQESQNIGFRDHWPIASREELNPDDPRVERAHRLVKAIMERRQREREAAEQREREAKNTNTGNPTNTNPATTQPPAAEMAETEDVEVAEQATQLPCRACGAETTHAASYCIRCGATLFPDEHYTLWTRAFCPEDESWYQFLTITDCTVEQHDYPVSQEFYAGKIPVNRPVSRIGVVRVGNILNTTSEEEVPEEEREMLPVAMINDSVEYTRRIIQQERQHPFSDEGFATAGHTYDGYTSIKATELLAIAHQQLRTMSQVKKHGKDESIAIAMEIIATHLESKRQPEEKPTLRQQAWAIGKWIIVGAIVFVLALVVVIFVLPILFPPGGVTIPTNSTLPGYFGVRGGIEFFLNPGSPTPLFSPPHHFFVEAW